MSVNTKRGTLEYKWGPAKEPERRKKNLEGPFRCQCIFGLLFFTFSFYQPAALHLLPLLSLWRFQIRQRSSCCPVVGALKRADKISFLVYVFVFVYQLYK